VRNATPAHTARTRIVHFAEFATCCHSADDLRLAGKPGRERHHIDYPCCLGCRNEIARRSDGICERLGDQDMLVVAHGFERNRDVELVGRADEHRVNRAVAAHLAVVGIESERFGNLQFRRQFVHPLFINVAESDDTRARCVQKAARICFTDAHANNSDAYFFHKGGFSVCNEASVTIDLRTGAGCRAPVLSHSSFSDRPMISFMISVVPP
jgi:hypothetical protein